MLEKADGVYKELVQHRNQLDNLLVALASGAVVISRSGVRTISDYIWTNGTMQYMYSRRQIKVHVSSL